MEDGKVILQVPTQLLHGILNTMTKRYELIEDMLNYAIYKEYTKTNNAKKAYDNLGIRCSEDSMMRWIDEGEKVAKSIKTKSSFFIPKDVLFELRDHCKSYDYLVMQLMYYALGSIQGNQKDYAKCNNLFLLSRMDGKDAQVNSKSRLSAKLRMTRYKIDKYKSMLEKSNMAYFYGYGIKGFFFTTKTGREELIKNVMNETKYSIKKEQKREGDRDLLNRLIKEGYFGHG